MGFFWDLLQQYQIGKTNSETFSQAERIEQLERDMQVSRQIIEQMANRLDEIDQAFFSSEDNAVPFQDENNQLP